MTGSGRESPLTGGSADERNDEYQAVFNKGTLRRKHKPSDVLPPCDCEFRYRDYLWKRFSEYEPTPNGVEIREVYAVSHSGKEVFTYAEGAIGGTSLESQYPFVCGEIVSSKKLASAGKLKNLYAWVQSQACDGSFSVRAHNVDERPLHVVQRQESDFNRSLTSLPVTIEKNSKVVVFRTHGTSLFVQLMPTIRSESKLIAGTPLFDRYHRGIRAAVGSMFSQHEYIINCAPTEFCEIPINKNKQGSDRLFIICLDRRGVNDRMTTPRKNHLQSVLSLVGFGLGIVGGTNNKPELSNTPTSCSSIGDIQSIPSSEIDTGSDNAIIYRGVVNDKFQITDSFVRDKKNKSPQFVVTITIDDDGVCVNCLDEKERSVFTWVHKDPKISYGIMSRRCFSVRANVIDINTAERSRKKESVLKRFKSLERLI